MPTITLPDGSTRAYDAPVSAAHVARDIGPRLARDAVGAKIDGELRDLATIIDRDCSLAIVTPRTRAGAPDTDALYLLRHSAAHVMAEAIQRLFPNAQLVYGPPLENGFFYDIAFPEGQAISSDDFEKIEAKMREIIAEDRPFTRYEFTADDGFKKLRAEGSKYKKDNAKRAMDAGARTLSWYITGWPGLRIEQNLDDQSRYEALVYLGPHCDFRYTEIVQPVHGEVTLDFCRRFLDDVCRRLWSEVPLVAEQFSMRQDTSSSPFRKVDPCWEDLCRGPHLPSTGRIGACKVLSLASSYWHGDEKSDRLTRVYGTAFFTQDELDEYLARLEQAKQRDHRVIGKQLGLFHIDERVGGGLILWKPKGSVIRRELEKFISSELIRQGYDIVYTPHIAKLDLFRTSGHFPYYQASQYPPIVERETLNRLAREGCSCAELANLLEKGEVEGYLLKPMNCPHHIRIYQSEPRSYRDLPVRLAEFGTVYRWEQSGEIGGMTRVRGFTQDDAHIFCAEDQLHSEVLGCLSIVRLIFSTLNMTDYRVRLGLRDPDSSKYVGESSAWDKAEDACRRALEDVGIAFTNEPGEAAFYGPKIDFIVKDVIGRDWQLGTVQVDYNLPQRFDLSYTSASNEAVRPVMIHRAPFGSMERFVGVLIEHFAGAFPTWLAPEQVRVLPVSEKSHAYARKVRAALHAIDARATLDDSNERLPGKIRAGSEMKIPYLLIVGPRDEQAEQVSVRAFGVEKDLGALPLPRFVEALRDEIASRGESSVSAALGAPLGGAGVSPAR